MLKQQISARWRQRAAGLYRLIPYGATAFFSFFLSNVRILGNLSPFGCALAMAMPGGFSLSSAAGGLLGCLFLGNFERNIPYLIALLCVLAFKLAVAGRKRLRENTALLCGTTFLILAGSLGVGAALSGDNMAGLLLRLLESALGGAMTFFGIQAGRGMEDIVSKRKPGSIRFSSLVILCLIALIGISRTTLWIFNPGRILAAAALLWIAGRKGVGAGAVGGLAVGAALALANPDYALGGGILALAVMLSGYFSHFGRLTQSAVCLSVMTAGILVTGGQAATVAGAFDLLAASAIYLLIPDRIYLKLRDSTTRKAEAPVTENRRVAARLDFASHAIEEIRESVDAVSRRLGRMGGIGIDDVYENVSNRVCRHCGLKMFCWETAYSQTTEAFQKLTPILKEKGRVFQNDLPHFFQGKCPKIEELVQNINGCYHEFVSRENAGRKVLGAKQVALEQLDGISAMLQDVGQELEEGEISHPEGARRVEDFLIEIGENADQVYCIVDTFGRMRLEIYRPTPFRTDKAYLTEQLSELLERPFDYPCVITAGEVTRICFFEQALYTLQLSASQKNAVGSRVCGDCYEYFADSKGFAHIIVSDGMGSGGRAAVDSIMTCNFVLKLVKAGFRFDAALKLINSALLVKAGDESLATLDIGCIDLYTGEAEFLKAGGASSFLCRQGETTAIKGVSLPVGILQGISYDRRKAKLREGDLLVMVTDGAVPISDDWLCEEISALSAQEPQKIADKLVQLAAMRQQGNGDDITVIAARLVRAAERE